jgi:integrase
MSRPRTTNSHLPKYVTVIHGSYWYRPPKAKACRIGPEGDYTALYRFLARLGDAAPAGETLSDCFDRYAREVLPGKAPKTRRGNMAAIAKLRATFGHMRPDEVKPRDIGRYLSVGAPIARNKEIALLSHVYTKAVSRWYVAESNPCRNVERNESRPRTRYITDAEFEAFWNAVPERLRVAMDLALLTGQRQGDLLQLEWSAVSEEGVFFQQGKTGKKLLVGMSPALREVLDRARTLKPELPRTFVIRKRNGKPYTSDGFRAIWQRLMRRHAKAGALRFTFHDIRAKSISDTANLQDAYERAGHTSPTTTRRVYDRSTRKVTPLR